MSGESHREAAVQNSRRRYDERFGRLLRGAINSIAAYEAKSATLVEDELGVELNVSGATIQRYKSGSLPPEIRSIELLAIAALRRGFLGREWLGQFLRSGRHPRPDLFANEYFGDTPTASESVSVTAHFEFPEQIRIPCEQYLLYFVEFLRDIGIEADAILHNDAGKLLFAVTPKHKDEALDNIREALEVYLRLPTSRNITSFISPETTIEVQRLSAQVMHLQSQLMLASAAYQQKELATQQQSLIIQQQQMLIQQQLSSGQILVQSLQESKEDSEAMGTELIKVKPWSPDAIPLEFNLPELMRRLKEKFSRKQLPPGE